MRGLKVLNEMEEYLSTNRLKMRATDGIKNNNIWWCVFVSSSIKDKNVRKKKMKPNNKIGAAKVSQI